MIRVLQTVVEVPVTLLAKIVLAVILTQSWFEPLGVVVTSRGSTVNGARRCPTLPHRLQCSTIGAERLSFRVRNGTGRFPLAITAVTLWKYVDHPQVSVVV